MKLGMFRDYRSMANWYYEEARGIEAHGLKLAKETLADAMNETNGYKEWWFKMNGRKFVPGDAICEHMWNGQLDWLKGNVKYLENKVRKYRRTADKAIAMVTK